MIRSGCVDFCCACCAEGDVDDGEVLAVVGRVVGGGDEGRKFGGA